MKAVILAAGKAKRYGDLKPLIPLFGLPLIEHNIRGLLRMGIKDIAVVYNDDRIRRYLSKRYPWIEFIHNPKPERENGYSLYLAKEFVNESFILLMADHYFSNSFFEIRKFPITTAIVSKKCHNSQEATKIKVSGKYVINIGKNLKDYDFFDTGMFYCTPEIFKYAEEMLRKNKEIKLSEIMQNLAYDKKLGYYEIDDLWIDIDTKEDLKIAERELRRMMIKEEDGYISRYVNRRISLFITKSIVKFSYVTPNFLTGISFLLGIVSSLFLFFHYTILGGIFTQITSIVDGCDGEIARLKRMNSKFGASLDAIIDRYIDVLLLFAILFNLPINPINLTIFFFAVTGVILFSYAWHLTNIRIKIGGRDIRLFLIFIFSIFSPLWPEILALLLGIIGSITHISVVLSLAKMWYSEKKEN